MKPALDYLTPSQLTTVCNTVANAARFARQAKEMLNGDSSNRDSLMTFRDGVRAGRCLLPVTVYAQGNEVGGITLTALVDTGAMNSAIHDKIADVIGLPPTGPVRLLSGPYGVAESRTYQAVLDVPMLTEAGLVTRRLCSLADMSKIAHPVGGAALLIGMDIISQAHRFSIEDGIWTLEF